MNRYLNFFDLHRNKPLFEKSSTVSIYQNDYISSYEKKFLEDTSTSSNTIIRDGIFNIAWKYYTEGISANAICPILSAKLLSFDKNQKFYQIISDSNSHSPIKNILFLLFCDESNNFNQIDDAINSFESKISNIDFLKTNFYFHLSVPQEIDLKNYVNNSFVKYFISRIENRFAKRPINVSPLDLFKVANMSEWLVFELSTEWYISDNFFLHYCLSRGAQYHPQLALNNVNQTFQVSAYHKIKIGTLNLEAPIHITNSLPFHFFDHELKKTKIEVPKAFQEAIYSNIY